VVWAVSLSTMDLRTHCLTPGTRLPAFVVWFGSVSGKPPRRSSALPPGCPRLPKESVPGLHLNAFRGEPAISGFAWHFTAIHNSSGPFVTDPGAALHERVPPASAWSWVDHPVSGRHRTTPDLKKRSSPFRTRVRSGSGCPCLSLAARWHSLAHSTKGTPSPSAARAPGSDRPEAHGFRSISLPSPGCFSPFPHGTGSLSVVGGI
jgi:hypothetical protein